MSSCCAIVVSYRTGPVLADSMQALRAARGLDEIVIVDNGNPPAESDCLDAVARDDRRVRLLRGQGNIGFGAACNHAARFATSEVLCFVNPDVLLKPDALERLVRVLTETSGPAIVGGDLRDLNGRPDRGSRRERLTLWRALVYASGLARLERLTPLLRDFNRHTDPLPSEPAPVGAVSGALMLMRRTDFQSLGGFDEGYFLHVEDVDLCRRAEERGWPVLFAPGPHGVHVRSTSQVDSRAIKAHKARSMARYLRKYASNPVERVVSHLVAAGLLFANRLNARSGA